jgi:hypothetical protein
MPPASPPVSKNRLSRVIVGWNSTVVGKAGTVVGFLAEFAGPWRFD